MFCRKLLFSAHLLTVYSFCISIFCCLRCWPWCAFLEGTRVTSGSARCHSSNASSCSVSSSVNANWSKHKLLDNSGTFGWSWLCSSKRKLFSKAISILRKNKVFHQRTDFIEHCRIWWVDQIYLFLAFPHCIHSFTPASSQILLSTYCLLSFFALQAWICLLCALLTSCPQPACLSTAGIKHPAPAVSKHHLFLHAFPTGCLSSLKRPHWFVRVVPQASCAPINAQTKMWMCRNWPKQWCSPDHSFRTAVSQHRVPNHAH